MQNKIYSAFTFEVKAVDTKAGTFSGVASKYGVEDSYGDIIERGAFTKTIKERSFPILWQHSARDVIGSGRISEKGDEVTLEAELDMDDPLAVKALGKIQKKLIQGLSIGFEAIKFQWEEVKKDGVKQYIRHIQELKLWEVSVVTFPALAEAQITAVKSQHDNHQALAAKEGTPSEPPAASEPPPTTQEPVVDHSWLDKLEA